MDPPYPPESEQYREKIQAFLHEYLPSNWAGIGALQEEARTRVHSEWRETLRDNQLLAANWPAEYGGGGPAPLGHLCLNSECPTRGVPPTGPNDGASLGLGRDTLPARGSAE